MFLLSKKNNFIINAVFVLVELTLLCLILFAKNIDVNIICFITVCLAFIHGGAFVIIKGERLGYLYLLAMLFTVVSDVFLVLRYSYTKQYLDQAVAMTCFSFTQLFYFLFIILKTNKNTLKWVHIIVRSIVSIIAVVLTLVVLKDGANYMIVVTMFYFANLVLNAVFAFIEFKKNYLMAIGLFFFILCDILIGLSVAVSGNIIAIDASSFLYKMVFSSFNFAWLFYVISQTLLSIYISRFNGRKALIKPEPIKQAKGEI